MNINKLLKLFYNTGFLDGEKLKHLMPVIDQVKNTMDILYNQGLWDVFRFYTEYKGKELKAHISRIHLWDGLWLCQHHAGSDGYGFKVLADMIRDSIADNTENIKYFSAFYQPTKPFPNAIYGDVYREVNDDSLITETPYGYAYLKPVPGIGLSQRTVMTDREDTKHWPVLKHSVKQILSHLGPMGLGRQTWTEAGFTKHRELKAGWDANAQKDLQNHLDNPYKPTIGAVYHNYSAPGINFSSYTNSTVLELLKPVTLSDISSLIREDVPVMWTPLNYLLDVEPEKVYHFWKAKIDRRLWKYFSALEGL
jgi:hypothetical protein